MYPLDELWEIIDHIVLHLLCLLPRLSSQSRHVHKQNSQTNSQRESLFWTNSSYLSIATSFLTLIYPYYLTQLVAFLTIGTWSKIPHSLRNRPSGRLFFPGKKKGQDLYFQRHSIFFSHLNILETSCQNSWVLPLSFLECVYFFSKCQESWNILIKKNWQLLFNSEQYIAFCGIKYMYLLKSHDGSMMVWERHLIFT